jgi:hypothetical protein
MIQEALQGQTTDAESDSCNSRLRKSDTGTSNVSDCRRKGLGIAYLNAAKTQTTRIGDKLAWGCARRRQNRTCARQKNGGSCAVRTIMFPVGAMKYGSRTRQGEAATYAATGLWSENCLGSA